MNTESLYMLNKSIHDLMFKAETLEWEELEKFDFNAEMATLVDKMGVKMDSMIDYIFAMEWQNTWLKAKLESIQNGIKIREKRIESIKKYMLYVIESQWITEMDTGEHILKIQKKPPSVKVLDEEKISNDYKKSAFTLVGLDVKVAEWLKILMIKEGTALEEQIKVVTVTSLTDIKEAIKKWKEVPGAILESGVKLVIK